MKSAENIEDSIRNPDLGIDTNAEMDQVILSELLEAQQKSKKTRSAAIEPNIRRTILKIRIIKLAAAAVVIAVVVLGLFEFIETENTSGVVWAEVARKVEASRGLVVRCTESFPSIPESLSFLNDSDYSIKYVCPTHSRTDTYKGGQITQSYYTDHTDADTKTITGIYHRHKRYLSRTFQTRLDESQVSGPDDPVLRAQETRTEDHRWSIVRRYRDDRPGFDGPLA